MSDVDYLLDVNVPMYAAGRPHPYKQACVWVMTEIAEGRLAVAIDAEVIQEVLHRFGRLRLWAIGFAMASSLLDLVSEVYPIDEGDVRTAVGLFEGYAPQGVKARDLIHAAVMYNRGLSRVISVDQHFDRIDGIGRIDPVDLWRSGTAQGA